MEAVALASITAVVALVASAVISALQGLVSRRSHNEVKIMTQSGKEFILELDNLSAQDTDKLASALKSAAQGDTGGLEKVAEHQKARNATSVAEAPPTNLPQ